ncbi:MAG: DUF4369 domain-containing protein [Bacteroidales bacterium]|jgi:hypothetical protein|nr:DUF4369 domain-containing protein [Bacteroidales bacterium]
MIKMKPLRLIYLALSMLLILSCNKQPTEHQFSISGSIEQTEEKAFILSALDSGGYKVIDTIRTDKKGFFTKTYQINYQTIYTLALSNNDFAMFVAQPKDQIKITANATSFASSYNIENSPISEQLKLLNKENMVTRQRLAFLSDLLYQNKYEENFNQIKAKVKEEYTALQQQERQFTLDFIDRNLGNLASVVALYRTFDGQWLILADELDIYNKVLSGLKKTMPNNPQTIYLQNCIQKNQNLINHLQNEHNGIAKQEK